MEEGRRSGDPSGYLVKNRSTSGCLIVRKKGNGGVAGVGFSGSRKLFRSKKEKKRVRMDLSDSESSEKLLMPPRRRLAPETIRVCNGSLYESGGVEESDIGRIRSRGENVRNNEVDVTGRNGENFNERKRNRLDVFEFDEYDGNDGEMKRRNHFYDGEMEGRRFFGSITVGGSGLERDYETGSSRHPLVDRRSSYFERISGLNQGDHGDRDRNRPRMPFYGNKYDSDEPIRVQGKNGVLKVMVNKKKKVTGSLRTYDGLEVEGKRKSMETEDTVKRNVLMRPSFYPESKSAEKASPFVNKLKNPMNKLKSSSAKSLSINGKIRDQDSEDSGTSLKLGPKSGKARNTMKTPLSIKSLKDQEVDSGDSDSSLKLGPKNAEARKFMNGASSVGEITPHNDLPPTKTKEGKVKRGTGTEKQKLRERIRGMLLNAGWTIDYRPRRNRDYLDAVYINPNGTAYWSIIKAYDALLKQSNDDEDEARAKGDASFMPLSVEVLSQLTRKTQKKMEKEMKRKQRDGNGRENAKQAVARRSSRHDEETMDSGSNEEKLSSFLKQGSKSVKSRNGSSSLNSNTKGQGSSHHTNVDLEKMASGFHSPQGRISRKLGRCTLLVRNSNEGLNSDSDGFVPYSSKRTVLSWLIDCGTVQLSQKVRYMNRRRTRVMLEGWVTRDGIHCGCCSKILTVSKFEIHAGSKLRQPFQNIYLDSGLSLLECQIDAWNRQESAEHIGFHSVDVDGDDPNDDTCGLCGDGGDLICCDSCPSTFHQSCLDIEMLPPGDWHCPNCTCKSCGIASEQDDDTTVCELLTCTLCAKKYHKSCSQETDTLSTDTNSLLPCFCVCGKGCRETFEQLQKYLGVKHELEAGFSWCLIRRTDVGMDTSPLGVPQRVENNSKLAVALSVMDECFLPIVDRRSGINIIHNVLYNCRSNFNRLNYSGFYAAILERGDEIISAASIRFHGTQLAEMPFIGTRHIYRRQGMCRRLFCAIESALCSLKVQKLIIPAISELTHAWTGVFGFTTLEESLKQELKHMNMLVFPGIDMLQKQLSEQENIGGSRTTATGAKGMEFEDSPCNTPEPAVRSAKQGFNERDNCDFEDTRGTNDEVPTRNSDSQSKDGLLSQTPVNSSSLDSANEHKDSIPLEEMGNTDFDSGVKLNESASENKRVCISGTSHDLHKMDIRAEAESPVENKGDVSPAASESLHVVVYLGDTSVMKLDASSEQKNALSFHRTACADMESGDNVAQLTSESKASIVSDLNGDIQEEKQPELASPFKNNIQSCKEGNIENAHSLNLNESASDDPKIPKSIEDANPVKQASNWKCQFDTDTDNGASEMQLGPLVEPAWEDKFHSNEEDMDLHALNADNTVNGTDNSCKQNNSDQNGGMAFKRKAN